jgi:hypothetical protein
MSQTQQPKVTKKVTISAIAGAVVTVLSVASRDALGYEMSSELTGALVTIIMAGFMYFTRE